MSQTVFCQSKVKLDSLKTDSLYTYQVLLQLLGFMQDKNVGVKDYSLMSNIINAFIEEKKKQWLKK